MSIKKLCIFVTMSLLLTGCGTPTFNLNLKSAAYLNPDAKNNSLPVQVAVFQLNSKTSFENASFRDLWRHDKAALGDSLLSKSDFAMIPNSKKNIHIQFNKKTEYIGVVAIYRNPQGGQWRSIKRLTYSAFRRGLLRKGVSVQLRGNSINIVS